MSDPVTNAEVEDVLSSIRRLVSEEKRPAPAARAAAQSDRLVLTPALRIEESEPIGDDWNTEMLQDEALQDAPDTSASSDVFQLENPQVAPVEPETPAAAAPDAAEDDYITDPYNFDDENDVDGESDDVLTLPQKARSDVEWAEAALAELENETAEAEVEFSEDEPVADEAVVTRFTPEPDTNASDTKAATLSAKIEALESAIGGIEDEFEPDEAGTDAYSGTEAPAMSWEDDLSQDDADMDVAQKAADFHSSRVPEAALPVEEVEDGDFEDDFDTAPEPVEEELVEQATEDTMLDMEERIEEAVIAATSPEAQQDDQPFAFASDHQFMDEEALRDMVGDIVRSELQGALGERITRNVRKLVRREIHRALTTQDLE